MEFQERFATEAACLEYLSASRWPDGFRCPACGRDRAWVLERRHLWECAALPPPDLGHRGHGDAQDAHAAAALVLGRLPGRHPPPRGSPPSSSQRQLGISRYETAWLILQKLRRAMVAPEREPLRRRGRGRRVLPRRRTSAGAAGRQPARQEGPGRRRGRGPRQRLGAAAARGARRRLGDDAERLREGDVRRRGDRPHRRLARLRPARQAPAIDHRPAPQRARRRTRSSCPAPTARSPT